MDYAKPFYKSKTILFNVLAFLALALPEVATLPMLESWQQEIAVAVTLINLWLRFATVRPVTIKPDA